jgi:uncharacterized protein YjiS (DUF1127 family)
MNARIAKEEIALLMPTTLASYAGAGFTAPEQGAGNPLVRIVRWFLDLPRRRAVIAELSALSDHELADIGLSRSDLARVFDPAFAAQRSNGASYNPGRAALA